MGYWVNKFEEFWNARSHFAQILRNTSPETEYQWNWVSNRTDGRICIELCNDPLTNRPLTFKDGIFLIADALENYRQTDWQFLPKRTEDDSAAFAVYILDPRSRAQRIYAKIAVKRDTNIINSITGDAYVGDRIKLWSFHPPTK